jgi:hypothetical protein
VRHVRSPTTTSRPQLHLRRSSSTTTAEPRTVADFVLTGTEPERTTSRHEPGRFGCWTAGRYVRTAAKQVRRVIHASAWVCVGGYSERVEHHVGLRPECATCTITKQRHPPQLHLRKVVVNDNGGTATVADFVLTGNGTGANDISGTSPVRFGCWTAGRYVALSET